MAKLTLPQVAVLCEMPAAEFEIPKALLVAICRVESDFNTSATRYEKHWNYLVPFKRNRLKCSKATEESLQKHSWGLMQVMGSNLRRHGFGADFLSSIVADPGMQVWYGAKHLAGDFKRYDGDALQAVAAYNAGSARKKQDGTFRNQRYVNKVAAQMAAISGEIENA